jgi:4-hydroxybenzoate polyprenyltransferase
VKAIILCLPAMLIPFVKLIRWRNLLIVAGIQCMVFFTLLDWRASVMTWPYFLLLVLVTLCITAAGNVINDYYDSEADKINKPGATIVDTVWSGKTVLTIYKTIIVIGAVAALWFAYVHALLIYFPIYLLAVVGLQLYSSRFQCLPFIGNVWVALYCGATVLVVAAPDILNGNAAIVHDTIWYYIIFAMLTTLFREITKDIEDREGDQAVGCGTYVVSYGLEKGKTAAVIIGVICIIAILVWEDTVQSNMVKIGLYVLEGTLVGACALIWWAKDNSYYSKASTAIKLVMIGGTLMLLMKPLHT